MKCSILSKHPDAGISAHAKKPGQDGQALVEFALILGLLMLLTFGIIEFAILLYDKVTITHAAREGARTGVLFRVDSSGNPMSKTQIETEARNAALNYLQGKLYSFGTSNLNVVANWQGTPPSRGGTDGRIEVRVNFTYRFLVLPNFMNFGSDGIQMSSLATMRTE